MRSTERRIIKYSFGNAEQLSNFLHKLLQKLDDNDCFNILAHQIGDHIVSDSAIFSRENIVTKRLERILETGLDVEKYGSIYSTTKLITNTDDKDVNAIINYSIYDTKHKVVCLFAVPKYMYVDGKYLEFSSCNGYDYKLRNAELVKAYKNISPPPDHFKCCLLDAVKTSKSLSTKTLIAAYDINPKTDEISLYLPCTHFIYSEKDAAQYYNEQEQRLKTLFESAGTCDIYDAIVHAYSREAKWWQSIWDEDYS